MSPEWIVECSGCCATRAASDMEMIGSDFYCTAGDPSCYSHAQAEEAARDASDAYQDYRSS